MTLATVKMATEPDSLSIPHWLLPDADERWVVGYEGLYAVTDNGEFVSYARGTRYISKTFTKNGYRCVSVFLGYEPKTYKIGDLVAQAFLGTTEYIFIDGDRANPTLSNLCAKEGMLGQDERWIQGFEYQYSIDRAGAVHSYKKNIRKPMKLCRSLSKSKRVCLTKRGEQVTVYTDHLISKYFDTALFG